MCFGTIRCSEMWPQWSHDRHNRDWRRPRTWPSLMSSPVVPARAGCTHVLLHMLGGPSSPRRVVLSTVALSNESCCTSTAPSPAWWRRWGHAESSYLSRSPPRCPACSHSPVGCFQRGVRWDVLRPAPHCRRRWKERLFLFRKVPEWKYIRRHVGMCSAQKRSHGWTLKVPKHAGRAVTGGVSAGVIHDILINTSPNRSHAAFKTQKGKSATQTKRYFVGISHFEADIVLFPTRMWCNCESALWFICYHRWSQSVVLSWSVISTGPLRV